ncbi:hypothetical protein HAX54_038623 [Datura stramonium]|uniref:Uncharacterized protein n=1 Tax=Datura stramonium TaxID=4076 RepID=A0ABS8SI76_DATST|nr:hypothetical protein [Datura stramonium]
MDSSGSREKVLPTGCCVVIRKSFGHRIFKGSSDPNGWIYYLVRRRGMPMGSYRCALDQHSMVEEHNLCITNETLQASVAYLETDMAQVRELCRRDDMDIA